MANVGHTFDGSFLPTLLIGPADQASANTSWHAPFADGRGATRATYLLVVGTLSAEEVDFKLRQATDSSGTGAKDVIDWEGNVVKITQITTSTDFCVKTVEISAGALDLNNGYKYIQGVVTVDNSGTENYTLLLLQHGLREAGSLAAGTANADATYTESVIAIGS